MKKIAILTLDGLFDSSLAVTLDILKSAQKIHDTYCKGTVSVDVVICSPHSHKRLKTGASLELIAHACIDEIEEADYVIVPGLGLQDPAQIEDILDSKEGTKAVNFLAEMHKKGATVTASCSAGFLVAEAGIFDGQHATTSWWLSDQFSARYPDIILQTKRLLVSGPGYICAGAAMAQADLMMAVIREVFGAETMRLTANFLLIDQREFQSQYILSGLITHRHPEIAKAEQWVRENIKREFSVRELADVVGMSSRTFSRRVEQALGISPVKFVQQLRLEKVIHLLETTQQSFEVIATEVGYSDTSSLRRLLLRATGKTPSKFRKGNYSENLAKKAIKVSN
ncbi:MAG: helix-turn-helix domain-containing protein [Sneathiella sp.]